MLARTGGYQRWSNPPGAAFRHGMSQKELGKAAGVTFQKIQKYEKDTNRMAASTLYHISRILDVSVIEFFAGLDGVLPNTAHLWLSRDEIKLLKIYCGIRDPDAQKHVMTLLETVAVYRLDN